MSGNFSIAIHGGAGTLVKGMMTAKKEGAYKAALSEAIETGHQLLKTGNSPLKLSPKPLSHWKILHFLTRVKEVFLLPRVLMKWTLL